MFDDLIYDRDFKSFGPCITIPLLLLVIFLSVGFLKSREVKDTCDHNVEQYTSVLSHDDAA